ncbi:MAG TPA: sugar ABC transporter substrate-binding protein [Spirochaetes bacterium]|nr:sugar ABC transporter substrate-binding protein [Spirochaetota bacterium]
MKKKFFALTAAVLMLAALSVVLIAGGSKGDDSTVGGGDVPYAMTSDFKSYVKISKVSVLRPDDERTVQPVNKVASKTIKIAYLGGQTNPFFDAVYAGVEAAKEELAPHNVIVDWIIPGASFGTGDYGEAIETLVTKGYHGIVTMIFNEGMIPYVDSAVNQGVAVASAIVTSQEPNKALFFIGQDLYAGGVKAAHALADELDEKGKVAIITGFFAIYGHEQRRLGFEDTIAKEYPGIEVVGSVENLDQADKGYEQTMDFLTAHPDLAAIYNTAGGPTGAVEALIQAGKIDDVKVVCFYVPELEPYVRAGQVAAGIAQDAYAEGRDTTIRLFNYLMDGVLPEAQNLFTEMFVVTPDTLDEFIASKQGA